MFLQSKTLFCVFGFWHMQCFKKPLPCSLEWVMDLQPAPPHPHLKVLSCKAPSLSVWGAHLQAHVTHYIALFFQRTEYFCMYFLSFSLLNTRAVPCIILKAEHPFKNYMPLHGPFSSWYIRRCTYFYPLQISCLVFSVSQGQKFQEVERIFLASVS